MKFFVHIFCLSMLLFLNPARGADGAADYDATTETVGRGTNGFETPVNQHLTPAGTLIELPGLRPQALALSPDGKLLVTAGITDELVVVNPANGIILQRVEFPSDQAQEQMPVSWEILSPAKKPQLSFTGLAFSPTVRGFIWRTSQAISKCSASAGIKKFRRCFQSPCRRWLD